VQELATCANELVDCLDHVDGNADRARLIGDAPGDRLTDPPRCVRAKFVPATIFEFIHRLHQADIAFLNKIKELQAAVRIFFSNRDNETEIGFNHFLLRKPGFAFALLHHVNDAAEFAK
jgi:hypothetical protein